MSSIRNILIKLENRYNIMSEYLEILKNIIFSRICLFKVKNIYICMIFALIFFPLSVFISIIIGGMLGIGWGSYIGGKIGGIIGLIKGYSFVWICLMVIGINIGNIIGYISLVRSKIIKKRDIPRQRVVKVVIFAILIMHLILLIPFGIYTITFKKLTPSQIEKDWNTFKTRYKEGRGHHAKMYVLRAKEILRNITSSSQEKEVEEILSQIEHLVYEQDYDKLKYVKFRMTLEKACKDKKLSSEELNELRNIFR